MNNMATNCTRNLSFEQAQAMWPGVTLDPTETFTFRTEPMPAFETLAYGPTTLVTLGQRPSVTSVPTVDITPAESRRVDYSKVVLGKPPEAVKFDQGKTDWALVPFEALEGMVKVLEFGKAKYGAYNFAESDGLDYNRLISASIRHITAFSRGEDNDFESNLSHISHAACNLLFLSYFIVHKDKFTKNDNRHKI